MPAFPDGLEIDHKQNLNGTMGAYAEQILIATGKDDWKSRIEEEDDAHLQRRVKDILGRKGELMDPYHNILITNVSFPAASSSPDSASAYLFPSFKYIPSIPLAGDSVKEFIRGDARCGILGPLLRDEFEEKLKTKGIDIRPQPDLAQHSKLSASVGLISHIGGHKYAGNVIIYIPRTLKEAGHPLAGKGIWYGRVGPEQVEGVVEQTIVQGKVVKELFRGGIEDNEARTILRL
ncbi:Fmi1 protein [Neofusicoccum parvum]|nr:Fmi1 protein [Neofusicoccum parvum]